MKKLSMNATIGIAMVAAAIAATAPKAKAAEIFNFDATNFDSFYTYPNVNPGPVDPLKGKFTVNVNPHQSATDVVTLNSLTGFNFSDTPVVVSSWNAVTDFLSVGIDDAASNVDINFQSGAFPLTPGSGTLNSIGGEVSYIVPSGTYGTETGTFSVTSGVTEPNTWLYLLLDVAVLGGVLRSSKSVRPAPSPTGPGSPGSKRAPAVV